MEDRPTRCASIGAHPTNPDLIARCALEAGHPGDHQLPAAEIEDLEGQAPDPGGCDSCGVNPGEQHGPTCGQPSPGPADPVCTSTATSPLRPEIPRRCERPTGHDGPHEANPHQGGVLAWRDISTDGYEVLRCGADGPPATRAAKPANSWLPRGPLAWLRDLLRADTPGPNPKPPGLFLPLNPPKGAPRDREPWEHSLGCPASPLLGSGEPCHWPCKLFERGSVTADQHQLRHVRAGHAQPTPDQQPSQVRTPPPPQASTAHAIRDDHAGPPTAAELEAADEQLTRDVAYARHLDRIAERTGQPVVVLDQQDQPVPTRLDTQVRISLEALNRPWPPATHQVLDQLNVLLCAVRVGTRGDRRLPVGVAHAYQAVRLELLGHPLARQLLGQDPSLARGRHHVEAAARAAGVLAADDLEGEPAAGAELALDVSPCPAAGCLELNGHPGPCDPALAQDVLELEHQTERAENYARGLRALTLANLRRVPRKAADADTLLTLHTALEDVTAGGCVPPHPPGSACDVCSLERIRGLVPQLFESVDNSLRWPPDYIDGLQQTIDEQTVALNASRALAEGTSADVTEMVGVSCQLVRELKQLQRDLAQELDVAYEALLSGGDCQATRDALARLRDLVLALPEGDPARPLDVELAAGELEQQPERAAVISRATRQALWSMSARIAERLAAETDPRTVLELIRAELHQALNQARGGGAGQDEGQVRP